MASVTVSPVTTITASSVSDAGGTVAIGDGTDTATIVLDTTTAVQLAKVLNKIVGQTVGRTTDSGAAVTGI
jgi:hypothetical protein